MYFALKLKLVLVEVKIFRKIIGIITITLTISVKVVGSIHRRGFDLLQYTEHTV